jgi:hypothetical protein
MNNKVYIYPTDGGQVIAKLILETKEFDDE